ncbi:uncharacterized protein LOC134433688 [Melospiza melodia melodia]|uniref:uncharacterized protein LOC134433688 n=1 Tax=Melospiza melodia melodia TaxID=1914991 RepID=UPI002FD3AC25
MVSKPLWPFPANLGGSGAALANSGKSRWFRAALAPFWRISLVAGAALARPARLGGCSAVMAALAALGAPSVPEIFATMEEGPIPGGPEPGEAWLESHGRNLGHFVNGTWLRPERRESLECREATAGVVALVLAGPCSLSPWCPCRHGVATVSPRCPHGVPVPPGVVALVLAGPSPLWPLPRNVGGLGAALATSGESQWFLNAALATSAQSWWFRSRSSHFR